MSGWKIMTSMEDRKEFKRFVALYWGQKVASSISHPNRIYTIEPSVMDYIQFLQLRSIESLTNEETLNIIGNDELSISGMREHIIDHWKDGMLYGQTFDKLRGFGILVPFGKYSVEEILKMGWVKLKR